MCQLAVVFRGVIKFYSNILENVMCVRVHVCVCVHACVCVHVCVRGKDGMGKEQSEPVEG